MNIGATSDASGVCRRMIRHYEKIGFMPQRDNCRIKEAERFCEFGERWVVKAPMADSTRAMWRSIFE